jgi:hypothetical protein
MPRTVTDYMRAELQRPKTGGYMTKTCEHNLHRDGRCRKRASVEVTRRVLWATKIGPHGSSPVYMERTTYRCQDHATLPDAIHTAPIA